ncbi:bacteriorhodopsin-like [soil metagenome]
MHLVELSMGEYQVVYNLFSLAIAAMLGSFVFFVLARQQLSPSFRPAMIMSSLVVLIAGYHYLRIFNNWGEAFHLESGVYKPTGVPFNDAYRYVDWLLTVPLLCAELVSVMNLKSGVRGPMMAKLVVAAVLMIALGYPGEIATDTTMRAVWGAVSTVPFLYILYVLWVEVTRAAATESAHVKVLLRNTRLLILGTWGFYPIAFLLPMLGIAGRSSLVGVQIGYSLADILAKCGYGVMIYAIARAKMEARGETAAAAEVAPKAA